MFVYYFAGNFVFGSVVYMFVALPVDRPFYAMQHLKQDIKDAERNEFYRLDVYLENFKSDRLRSIYEENLGDTSVSVPTMNVDQVAAMQEPMMAGMGKDIPKDLRVSEDSANR